LQIVGLVKSHLAAIVTSGRLAQRDLDDLAVLGERRRIFGVL
jgi:hypothetical protein